MFPLGDDNPTLRAPVVTYVLIVVMSAIWLFVQHAGADEQALAASICDLGLIPGRLTHMAAAGTRESLGEGMTCVVTSRGSFEYATLLTSMFLHGSWLHIIGNAWFLKVFGDNVEDNLGRSRFLVFYLMCGLVAAVAQVAVDPSSTAPIVGASGAISGVMGAYLVLYPRAQVRTLFVFIIIIRIVAVPAWFILVYWFGLQVLDALPQLSGAETAASSGVAVVAHVGGFVTGALLAKLFANADLAAAHHDGGA